MLGSAQLGRSAQLDSARPKRGRGEGRGRQRRGGQRGPTRMGTQLRSAPLLRCPEIPALVPRPSRGSRSVCPASPLSWQGAPVPWKGTGRAPGLGWGRLCPGHDPPFPGHSGGGAREDPLCSAPGHWDCAALPVGDSGVRHKALGSCPGGGGRTPSRRWGTASHPPRPPLPQAEETQRPPAVLLGRGPGPEGSPAGGGGETADGGPSHPPRHTATGASSPEPLCCTTDCPQRHTVPTSPYARP